MRVPIACAILVTLSHVVTVASAILPSDTSRSCMSLSEENGLGDKHVAYTSSAKPPSSVTGYFTDSGVISTLVLGRSNVDSSTMLARPSGVVSSFIFSSTNFSVPLNSAGDTNGTLGNAATTVYNPPSSGVVSTPTSSSMSLSTSHMPHNHAATWGRQPTACPSTPQYTDSPVTITVTITDPTCPSFTVVAIKHIAQETTFDSFTHSTNRAVASEAVESRNTITSISNPLNPSFSVPTSSENTLSVPLPNTSRIASSVAHPCGSVSLIPLKPSRVSSPVLTSSLSIVTSSTSTLIGVVIPVPFGLHEFSRAGAVLNF